MENMARDEGKKISITTKQGKTKPAEKVPVRSQTTDPYDQEIPKSSDFFRGKIPNEYRLSQAAQLGHLKWDHLSLPLTRYLRKSSIENVCLW